MALRWFTWEPFHAADAAATRLDWSARDAGSDGLQPPADGLAPASQQPAGVAVGPDGLRGPGLHHPLANRTARLEGIVVGYLLKRARRRSIGFSVRPDGLVVTAPGWVSIAGIEAALASKAAWIVRKLAEARERVHRAHVERTVWGDGASLPFLGATLTLRLDPAAGPSGAAQRTPGTSLLRVALPADAPSACIQDAVKAYLVAEARRLFEQRLAHFAPRLGVRWQRLSLCNAATRWGSASSNGSIRLHWRLIQMEPALLDYVVVHELSHLRVMDHSPRFWAVVASVLPDHVALRRRLKGLALPPWE